MQGNVVQCSILLHCMTNLPLPAHELAAQLLFDIRNQSLEVDDGVALEHLGQTVGQVAGQAAAGALVQVELEIKPLPRSIISCKQKADVVRPFRVVTKKRLEKLMGSAGWKESGQHLGSENLFRLHS